MRSDTEKDAGAYALKCYGDFFKKQFNDFTTTNLSDDFMENKTYLPIQVTLIPKETVGVLELASSDNTLMTKVIGVLSSLCVEAVTLRKEAFERHFHFLSLYDEYYNDIHIVSQIESVCLLSAFTNRCNEILRNLCTQIFAIFTEGIVDIGSVQLHYVINHIGEVFTVLVLLDLLISKTCLPKRWIDFCRSLKMAQNSPGSIGIKKEKVSALKRAADNIMHKMLNDDIVHDALSALLTLRKQFVNKNCTLLMNEFSQYIKLAIVNLEKLINEKPFISNFHKCIKINALFVLSAHLFGTNDKKVFKSLIDLNVKAHSIVVSGTTMWFPEQFLQKHASSMSSSYNKISQNMLRTRQAYLNSKKTSLQKDAATFQAVCAQWALSVENAFSGNYNELNAAEMSQHAKLLLEGVDIISQTECYIVTLLNLHLALGVPLSKSMLKSLFEVVDSLKYLQNIVIRDRNEIIKSANMIVQHLTFQATSSILELKKTLITDKNYANKRLDELTCLVIAERALKGTATIERNLAANIALSFVPQNTYVDDCYAKLGNLLEKVQTMTNLLDLLEKSGNCSWMLWHQNIIPIYFEQNFCTQLNVTKLKYFLMVLEDCIKLLHKMDEISGEHKSEKFCEEIRNLVDEKVLRVTSQNIETNLRLHIHSHLQLDVINPFVNDMMKKISMAIDKWRIDRFFMAVKPSVEHYLSTMYYNLTTVVLSDWKTYGEMRQMAKFKFNLVTVHDNLPTQTLEQGLDVLEIMRNIHIFVSKYLYNLNNQIFIEKSSNNKHLNSINIRHIANSIRTHGTGVMNTTVNFTYQFLKKKFFTFSQFMYDEHIKSRLIKDLRNFKENIDVNNNMYSYKSAERFNRAIKTLGLAEDGQSYLDLFRDLISQIGNAMGYVRMIRSGGRHCCSEATVFLPNLDNIKSFKDMCTENNMCLKTIQSSENLDHNINELVTHFIQGTEYFKLLVDVFAPVFRNPKNVHLKNFYIIVPPLTVNFVEHMILSKDKMSKKNKAGAAFTDDGFAMGVAYILKLLDQDGDFETLHWFDSIWNHIELERQALEEQKSKGSLQLQQALALTEKKIATLEVEYRLLYYSLTSARIFFR